MADANLWCDLTLPFVWKPAPDALNAAALEREAILQLAAINHMEVTHEMEASGSENRRMERLEAKLDLTLYLLARTLQPGATPEPRVVRLSPAGVAWHDDNPPATGTRLLLEMQPSVTLPIALRLTAMSLPVAEGRARANFTGVGETVFDALYQFVFRRHRQAIRARQG